jgi:hypothetical protein
MYNAKLVKEALASALKAIREVIGIDRNGPVLKKQKGDPNEREEKKISKRDAVHQRRSSFSSVSGEEGFDELVEAFAESDNSLDAGSGSGVADAVALNDDSDFDSETYAAFNARIASSSDDEEEEPLLDDSQINGAGELATGQPKEGLLEKRPAKSADVAKRLIHGHLGIRLSRNHDSDPSISGEGNTATGSEADPSPVGDKSSVAEEHIFSSESEDYPSAKVPTRQRETKPQLTKSKPDDRKKSEAPKTTKKKRLPREETSDSDEPKRLRTMATKASTSTFVPSLNMVGYWSGSESEASDVEEHVAPRKNRRGQRARQKIWEQKFGGSAKHLGEEAKAKQKGRDEGWDLRRGATGKGDDGWRKGKGSTWKGKDYNGENGGSNAIPVAVVKRGTGVPIKKNAGKDDAGPLHPSWEAKKVAKSKVAMVPFQGKKITFD